MRILTKTVTWRVAPFTHEKTKTIVLNAYDSLKSLMPERKFFLMECSNEHGGKIYPHRTHQNGLSIDFMMPKLKNNEPYYGLDRLGKNHYWLNFDNHGNYVDDPSVKIDFDLIAQHLLILESLAEEQGMKIEKVIIKVSYKEPLYNTEYGKKLKNSGIYIVKSLSPTIDNLHDEHYHVDFAFLE